MILYPQDRSSDAARQRMGHDQPSFRGAWPSSPAFFFCRNRLALALDRQRVIVMKQAIEDRRGEDVVAEELRPIA